MPALPAIQDTTDQVGTDQSIAALLLIFVVIVLCSGILALLLIVRGRLRRDIPKKHKPKRDIADAWQEAGRRLEIPPEDNAGGDPGEDDSDDDDDDGGEPTPPVPMSPETAASV